MKERSSGCRRQSTHHIIILTVSGLQLRGFSLVNKEGLYWNQIYCVHPPDSSIFIICWIKIK